MTDKFIRGNDRLTKMLADPEVRAGVETIVDEMGQIDRDRNDSDQPQGSRR